MKRYEATFECYDADSNETGRSYRYIKEYQADSLEEALETITRQQERMQSNIESGRLAACWGRTFLGIKEI